MKLKPALLLGIPLLSAALFLSAPAHAASGGARPGAGTPPGNKIWNGYVYLTTKNGKPTSKVNFVRAWWIQPPAACSFPSVPTDGIWVGLGGLGIGGNSSPLLVQAGTLTRCTVGGGTLFNAVWEIIPPGGKSSAVYVSSSKYPIAAGDQMFAAVSDMGGGRYSLIVQDEGPVSDWEWSKTVSLKWKTEPYSAEWIVESGSNFGLANFGSVVFTNCAYNQNLTTLTKAVKFEADTPPQAAVSAIHVAPGPDSSFVVTWRHS